MDIFLDEMINNLNKKDNIIRYNTFLNAVDTAKNSNVLYPYFDIFKEKLKSDNSYQRTIGLTLLAENAKWDIDNKFNYAIFDYLNILNDEKPITVRQCVQNIEKIIPYKQNLYHIITEKLINLDLTQIKDTMKKLILFDILNILILINKSNSDNLKIQDYILNAFTGGLLDKKSIKTLTEKMK